MSSSHACALCVALTSTALGAPQWSNERVSVSLAGGAPNDFSGLGSMTHDGRFIAFDSLATDLVGGDGNPYADVYVRDRLARVTLKVSVNTSGQPGNDSSGGSSLSADGRFVAFESYATNLASPNLPGVTSIYLRDLELHTTRILSVGLGLTAPNERSDGASISGDGRWVAFGSLASNLVANDTNALADVFVVDTLLETIVRANVSDTGAEANGVTEELTHLSADGRFVAFQSDASNLVAGDTDGGVDVFVRDLQLGTTRCATLSLPPSALQPGEIPRLDADGRHVTFALDWSVIDGGLPFGSYAIALHDSSSNTYARLDLDNAGQYANGVSGNGQLSVDARYCAFFSLATNLGAGASAGNPGFIYSRDRTLATTERVTVANGGGQPNSVCDLGRTSDDGRTVAFVSDATNLVSPPDTPGVSDVWVARRAIPNVVSSYCTAKTNSLGCVPQVVSLGFPSVSDAAPFWIGAKIVIAHKNGIGLFGFAPNGAPFQGGTLCVLPPFARMSVIDSGGASSASDCSGVFAYDFNDVIQSGQHASLVVGALVRFQLWYRDPASPSTTGLTDALAFTIQS